MGVHQQNMERCGTGVRAAVNIECGSRENKHGHGSISPIFLRRTRSSNTLLFGWRFSPLRCLGGRKGRYGIQPPRELQWLQVQIMKEGRELFREPQRERAAVFSIRLAGKPHL